jgi:AraC-like DNA-binding protein
VVLHIRNRRRLRQAETDAQTLERFIALAETCDQRIPLAQVSQVLGTNLRTLNHIIGELLGIAPGTFMRQRRLNRARELILAGEDVTHAAVELGFWQLSHFSRYYRAQFGELPSDTRRRTMDVKETYGTITLANPTAAMEWLTFNPSGLRINMRTGEVIIPEGLTLDAASRTFWEGLGRFHPFNTERGFGS